MHCPNCGAELPDGARFCGACGQPIDVAAVEETVVVEAVPEQPPAPEPAPGPAPEPQAAPGPENAYQGAPEVGPGATYQAPPQGAYQAPPQQPYQGYQQYQQPGYQTPPPQPKAQGILGAAWSDITGSQGWFKRMLLLIVMGIVPVLGFYVNGYLLQWSCGLVRGERLPLPKGAFDRKAFFLGFLYWVVSTLCGIAASVLFVLGFIPLVGAVLVFLCTLLVNAYAIIGGIRMALTGKVGAAFDLSTIAAAMKKNVGGLFAATFVPGLCVAGVGLVLGLIFGLAMGGMVNSAAMGYGGYGYGYGPMGALGAAAAVAGPMIFMIVLLVLVVVFCSVFANIWTFRALGHWVANNAPEWAAEADDISGPSWY